MKTTSMVENKDKDDHIMVICISDYIFLIFFKVYKKLKQIAKIILNHVWQIFVYCKQIKFVC